MRSTALDLLLDWGEDDSEPPSLKAVKNTLHSNADLLSSFLPPDFPRSRISDLKRHLQFAERGDFRDIVVNDIPDIEEKLYSYGRAGNITPARAGFEDVLHEVAATVALPHYRQGHFRVAVLEGMAAVLRIIQKACSLKEDGDDLIGKSLNPKNPLLPIADINTQAGQRKQRGMILLCQGAYARFRNPRAHTGAKEICATEAAMELVVLSRIAAELTKAAVKLAGKK